MPQDRAGRAGPTKSGSGDGPGARRGARSGSRQSGLAGGGAVPCEPLGPWRRRARSTGATLPAKCVVAAAVTEERRCARQRGWFPRTSRQEHLGRT